MSVRVTNNTSARISLPDPLTYVLKAREVKVFSYVEFDAVVNAPATADLIARNIISVESLEPVSVGYDGAWDGPRRFFLGTYQLWVDPTGVLRIKNGAAIGPFDGAPVGAGIVAPHGPTHVFNGLDPIPNIEVLEDLWNCTVAEGLLDIVYETGANTVAQANAGSIATMPVVGVIISKPTPTTALVARAGEVTGFAGLLTDQPYFAGLIAGTLTLSPPAAPSQVVQKVGYAKSPNTLVVEIESYTVRS